MARRDEMAASGPTLETKTMAASGPTLDTDLMRASGPTLATDEMAASGGGDQLSGLGLPAEIMSCGEPFTPTDVMSCRPRPRVGRL